MEQFTSEQIMAMGTYCLSDIRRNKSRYPAGSDEAQRFEELEGLYTKAVTLYLTRNDPEAIVHLCDNLPARINVAIQGPINELEEYAEDLL